MITLSEAENALKNIYLGTMSNLLNTTANPLLAKIEQTQADVYGNEIRTAVRWRPATNICSLPALLKICTGRFPFRIRLSAPAEKAWVRLPIFSTPK